MTKEAWIDETKLKVEEKLQKSGINIELISPERRVKYLFQMLLNMKRKKEI